MIQMIQIHAPAGSGNGAYPFLTTACLEASAKTLQLLKLRTSGTKRTDALWPPWELIVHDPFSEHVHIRAQLTMSDRAPNNSCSTAFGD